jgi:hypothetical protein
VERDALMGKRFRLPYVLREQILQESAFGGSKHTGLRSSGSPLIKEPVEGTGCGKCL